MIVVVIVAVIVVVVMIRPMIGNAVEVVVVGIDVGLLLAGSRSLHGIVSIRSSTHPDPSGIDHEETLVVLVPDRPVDDQEAGRSESAGTLGAGGQRLAGLIDDADRGRAGGHGGDLLAAVVPGDRAMILLAHQFAGLERWIGDLEDRDAVDEGIDPASDSCEEDDVVADCRSGLDLDEIPRRLGSVAGEVGGGDRRGPCDSCVPIPDTVAA